MSLWLLTHIPTWGLAVLVLGGMPLVSMVVCVVVRRRFPTLADGENNEVAGVVLSILGGIYGIVLAFVIVVLWEQYQEAQQVVQSEATGLSQIVRDSQAFPEGPRNAIERAVGEYTHAVVEEEWDQMSREIPSRRTAEAVDRVYGALISFEPVTVTEQVFYTEVSGELDGVVADRRMRLRKAAYTLPAVLEGLLAGGAIMIIGFMYFFGTRSQRIHLLMSGSVAILLAFNLLLGILLERPFAGDVAVENTDYQEGVLARFWEPVGAAEPAAPPSESVEPASSRLAE
ncbi:MAG: DUF4239 domain-containing protein [Acidimicrobiia bacterium]